VRDLKTYIPVLDIKLHLEYPRRYELEEPWVRIPMVGARKRLN